MDMLKKCLNPKVLVGLAIVAVLVAVFAPKFFFAVLPLLLLAACPLSMIGMMVMMNQQHEQNQAHEMNSKQSENKHE